MGAHKDSNASDFAEHGVEHPAVAAALDRVHPDEHGVYLQELLTHGLAEVIVIDRRFGVNAAGSKGTKERGKAVITRGRIASRLFGAGVYNGHASGGFTDHGGAPLLALLRYPRVV